MGNMPLIEHVSLLGDLGLMVAMNFVTVIGTVCDGVTSDTVNASDP